MAEVMWFYQRGTQTIGPVTQADLCLMFKRSELPLEINVYSDAIGQWTPAEQIRGFREAVLPPGLAAQSSAETPQALAAAAAVAATTTTEGLPSITTLPKPTAVPTTLSYGSDGTTPAARPWIRLFARIIDAVAFLVIEWSILVALYSFILGPMGIALRDYISLTVLVILTVGLAIFGWIVMAAFCMCVFATTPGKFLLGVRVRTGTGQRLSFGEAFAREWAVWIYGMGLGCLPVTLILLITSFLRLIDRGDTKWDSDHGAVFFHAECGPLRVLAALSLALVPGLAFVGARAAADFTFSQRPNFASNPIVFSNYQPQPIRVTPLVIPKLPDSRMSEMSGTWISVTTTRSGSEKLTVRNVLTLNPDGTFRQIVRISEPNGKSHPELGHQWSGTWDLDGNNLIQTVSISSGANYPVGKWTYELVEARFDAMTLKRTVEPDGFVNAGRKPILNFQRMTATVRIE